MDCRTCRCRPGGGDATVCRRYSGVTAVAGGGPVTAGVAARAAAAAAVLRPMAGGHSAPSPRIVRQQVDEIVVVDDLVLDL